MDADKLIDRLGGVSEAARRLETTKQNVHTWRQRGVPDLWQRYILLAFPDMFDGEELKEED